MIRKGLTSSATAAAPTRTTAAHGAPAAHGGAARYCLSKICRMTAGLIRLPV